MAGYLHAPNLASRFGGRVALATLLLCHLGSLVAGAAPAGRLGGPVQIFGVYRDCALDPAATDAISARLGQMGESVRPTPTSLQSAACAGSDCVRRLRSQDPASAQRGRLLGGRFRSGPNGETTARLWLSDLLTGETVYSDDGCERCDVLELLARQAANLIEKPPAAAAQDAVQREVPSLGEGAPSSATPTEKRVILSVKGGGVSSILTLSTVATKALRQLGYDVTPAGRTVTASSAGTALPTLELTVARDKMTGNSGIILRHLAVGGGQTALNIDCGTPTCSSSQLERLARMNIGILLDTVTPAKTYPLASLIAADHTQNQLQDLTECQPKVAALQPIEETAHAPAPVNTVSEDRPPGSSQQPEKIQLPPRGKYRPFLTPRRWIGFAVMGASVIGFGISGWLLSQNGKPSSNYNCSLELLPNQPCKRNTTAGFGTGFALSAAGLVLGVALVAAPN